MATRKIEVGPTGERLAANIKALRKKRGNMTLDDLSRRMTELTGRTIPKSGLSKIESGDRRVDVDDLVALAIALKVTPNRLLLTPEAGDDVVGLTADYRTTERSAWLWACAEGTGNEDSAPNPGGRFTDDGEIVTIYDFQRENRPHRPPVRLSPGEWRRMKPFEDRVTEIRDEVNAAGLNWRALVDDTVFEEHDDPEHEHEG